MLQFCTDGGCLWAEQAVSVCNAANVPQDPLCPQLLPAGDPGVLRDEVNPEMKRAPRRRLDQLGVHGADLQKWFYWSGPGKRRGLASSSSRGRRATALLLDSPAPSQIRQGENASRSGSRHMSRGALLQTGNHSGPVRDTGDSHKVKTALT